MMVSVLGMTGLLQAQSYTNVLSGNWSDSTSWKDGRIPPGGPTNQIYFDSANAMVGTNNLGSLVVNRFHVVAAKNVTLSGNDLVFTNTTAGVLPMFFKDLSMVFVVSNNITAKTNMTFYANNTGGSFQLFGALTSSNLLTKSGNGVLSFEANNATLNGGLSIINGTMLSGLSGASSATPFGTGNISLYGWGNPTTTQPMLSIVPSATGTTTLAGGTSVGSQLSFEGGTFLNVTTNGPASPVTFTYGPGGGAQVLNRVNRGVLVLSDQNSDDGNYPYQVIKAMGTSGGNNFILNGAAPEVNNGMVEPYMLGARSGSQVKGVFMTYDPTYGFKAISAYDKDDTFTGATSSHKVLIRSALTLSSDLSIYALTLVNNFTLNSVLTIGDGTRAAGLILNGPAAALSIAGSGSLNFGNSEGIIYCNNYNNIIGVPISGNNGITKAQGRNSAGTLILTNDSPNLLGTSVVAGGVLQLGNGAASGSIGSGLKMHPQTTLAYNRIDTNAPIGGVITPNGGNLSVNSGAMTLNSANLPASSSNSFGTLTFNNGSMLVLNSASTATNIFPSISSGTPNNRLHLQNGVNVFTAYYVTRLYTYQTGGATYLGSYASNPNMAGGYYGLTDGTLLNGNLSGSTGYWFLSNGGIGVMDIKGGTFNCNGGGGGVSLVLAVNTSTGVYYQCSGAFYGKGTVTISEGSANARAEFNLTDGIYSNNVINWGYSASHSGTAIMNLNGGLIKVNQISQNSTAVNSTINFNGATLQAVSDKTTFISASNAFVHAGGAVINDGGRAITIGLPLQAPTGMGVTALPSLPGGVLSGYSGAPYVEISGGSGKGATGVSLFDYTTGNVTGLVITCAGRDYQTGDSVTVTLKGGGQADNVLGSATIGAITSGGLTKIGAGTLTLSGTNTFTGATLVSAGTLKLSHTNALPSVMDVYITSASAAKVELSAGTHVIRKLYVDNVLQPKALLGAAKLPNSITGTGFFYPTQGRAGTLVTFM
jgi:autotransporter-associated beta strand protein